jgi:hypothetical protein
MGSTARRLRTARSAGDSEEAHIGRIEVVSVLDQAFPSRGKGYRDPAAQASRNDVPWLFLFEIGALGMLVAWIRRKLRLGRG